MMMIVDVLYVACCSDVCKITAQFYLSVTELMNKVVQHQFDF